MKYILSLIITIVITASSFAQQSSSLVSNFSLNIKNPYILPAYELIKKNKPTVYSSSLSSEMPYDVFDGGATRFNGRKNWTLNKKEIRIGFSATQFLGDLGGKDQIGTDYRLKDLDWPSTSLAINLGYRYRFHSIFATTTSLYVGMLKGDDALTKETYRSARNLSFRAPIIDITQRIDFMIYKKEKVGKRYNVRGLHGFKNRNEQVFVFAGIGIVGFISQAKYQGKWVNLRPLSTEGQGLAGGIKKHLPVTVNVPIGMGFRVGISREWRIGVEATYVKTFSDYIDDVHGSYYDKGLLQAQKGATAAALSDRSGNNQWFGTGQQRGDIQKDSYYYISVILTKNVTYRNYTKTHKHYKLQKGKYKF